MNIHDEMAQIQVPDRLKDMTASAVLRASKKKKRATYMKNSILSFLLCVMISACVLNYSHPVIARNLPLIGNAFAYIQDTLDFSGNFDTLASEIGESVHNSHLTVTMSEIYCDGNNLFISYIIESDKAFSELTENEYVSSQIGCLADSFIEDGNETYRLIELGAAGLEGVFLDDHTFAGSEYYVTDNGEFPENFNFITHISRIEFIAANASNHDHIINGNWNFSVPVAVNQSGLTLIPVGIESQNHVIDSVLVSPIMAAVYTSYPDIYGDTVNYSVVVIGDKSDERIDRIAIYGKTDGITKISRRDFDKTLSIYVIDDSTIDSSHGKVPSKEDFEKHAIVKAVVHLQ